VTKKIAYFYRIIVQKKFNYKSIIKNLIKDNQAIERAKKKNCWIYGRNYSAKEVKVLFIPPSNTSSNGLL
jgi:hypothetical protein